MTGGGPQLHKKATGPGPLCTVISLSCHGACWVLSITARRYHAIDSVSTIVGETARGAWSMVPPPQPQRHWSRLIQRKAFFFSKWTKLPSVPPCFPLAMHWKNEICLHCLPQKKKNRFHSPICGSIGTMGLRRSIRSSCDIPNSFCNYISGFMKGIMGTVHQDSLFQQMVPDPKLYV